MRRAVVLALVVLATAAAPAPASAAGPLPWCGTDVAALDRGPDDANGFAFHAIYARPAGAPDAFGAWAPRIVGDVTAVDAWWRGQDAGRTLRFDLAPFACESAFGRLDISSVQLSRPASAYASTQGGFGALVRDLRSTFADPDKSYVVWYDGDPAETSLCGVGGPTGDDGGWAILYLGGCEQRSRDELRPLVAAHEAAHALGAVASGSPHACPDDPAHVCDSELDLMYPSAGGAAADIAVKLLDSGRDDYYGTGRTGSDLREALYLERLDGSDRAAPTAPGALRVTNDRSANTVLSWARSTDDAGPVRYRVYRDGGLFAVVDEPRFVDLSTSLGESADYAVRAADAAGHLSPLRSVRFRVGYGIVDADGRLLRDTVPPERAGRVAVRRERTRVVLRWGAARDLGGLRGYEIRVGGRRVAVVRRPAIALARARVTAAVRIVPVDRAGNRGPATVVPRSRLR